MKNTKFLLTVISNGMNRLTIHNLISSIAQIVLEIIKVDQNPIPVRVGLYERQWSRNNDQRSSSNEPTK